MHSHKRSFKKVMLVLTHSLELKWELGQRFVATNIQILTVEIEDVQYLSER